MNDATWLHQVKEWGGWVFGGLSAALGIKKAVEAREARMDARAKAIAEAIVNDPNGAIARLNHKMDRVFSRLSDLQANVAAQGALAQRFDDQVAGSEEAHAVIHQRITDTTRRVEILEGRRSAGESQPVGPDRITLRT
jgi:septal ring factor EnvC (AmiA/AmiB activator)